jgi:hypothetical protein
MWFFHDDVHSTDRFDLKDCADEALWQAGLRQEHVASCGSRTFLVGIKGTGGQNDDGGLFSFTAAPQTTHEFKAIKGTVHANLGHDDISISGASQSVIRGASGRDREPVPAQVISIHLTCIVVGFDQQYEGAVCWKSISAWGSVTKRHDVLDQPAETLREPGIY